MRTCPFCAEEIQEAAVVCKHCGRDLPGAAANSPQHVVVATTRADGKRSHTTLYVLLAVAVLLAFYAVASRSSATSAPPSALAAAPQTRPPQNIAIVDEPALDIRAGYYLSWEWRPSDYRTCHVTGRVLGLAGGDKDVQVLLFDKDGFVNWKNNHEAKAYYQTGKQTASTLDITVPGTGDYVLVISNAYSLFTAKTVQARNVRATCTD